MVAAVILVVVAHAILQFYGVRRSRICGWFRVADWEAQAEFSAGFSDLARWWRD